MILRVEFGSSSKSGRTTTACVTELTHALTGTRFANVFTGSLLASHRPSVDVQLQLVSTCSWALCCTQAYFGSSGEGWNGLDAARGPYNCHRAAGKPNTSRMKATHRSVLLTVSLLLGVAASSALPVRTQHTRALRAGFRCFTRAMPVHSFIENGYNTLKRGR